MEALVSIVTPAFNAEKLIGRTIDSVIMQSYRNWEMIIIDDNSSDKTVEIVNQYIKKNSRIKLTSLKVNHGAPAAPRNIGVKQAKGQWIALLDADDIWHPNKLEYQMRVLQETEAQFCSTQMYDFSEDTDIKFRSPDNVEYEVITFLKQLRRYRTPTSSVVLGKELLLDNPFNEDPRYKAREDLECWLRIHECIDYSIKIKFPFLYYRLVQGQISGSKWTMLKRTLLVLGEYRLKSGRMLGWRKYLYLLTHIIYSINYRLIKKHL